MSDIYILPLSTEISSLDVLGGKGRSLAKMAQSGFAIPEGYYVTTLAYKEFVEKNNLQDKINELAKPEIGEFTLSFDEASADIQNLFGQAKLSSTMAEMVGDAYDSLTDKNMPVAVRSSATAEDLPDMSFAGQQDTYLNVSGRDAVVVAVLNCWASLWTPRAMSYRHEMGIGNDDVAMAVVVQLMVPSDVSGILFTANPATGERSEIIVNSSFGLGEAIVGGQVTPDTFVLDRKNLESKETIIGTKQQKAIAADGQGIILRDIPEKDRGEASLSFDALAELGEMALKVEAEFEGVPQDIEWGFSKEKLWLLQSRPITNLPPQPIEVSWDAPPHIQILSRRQIVENIPEPCTPLFDELYLTEGLETMENGKKRELPFEGGGPLFLTHNGFAYQRFDFPEVVGKKKQQEVLTEDQMEAAEIEAARKEFAEKQEVKDRAQSDHELEKQDLALFLSELSDDDKKSFESWSEAEKLDDLAHAITMPASEDMGMSAGSKVKGNEQFLREWQEKTMPDIVAWTEEWGKLDLRKASDTQLLNGVAELANASGIFWSSNSSHSFGVAKITDHQLQTFLKEILPDQKFTSGQFLSGFKSKTTEANESLFLIAKEIRSIDSLYELVRITPPNRLMKALRNHADGKKIVAAVDEYLKHYGHLGYSLDFGEPLPSDDPSGLLANVKTMVANSGYDPRSQEESARQKREKATREIGQLLEGLSFWQFRYRVWFAQRFYYIREEVMYYLYWPWPVLRKLALELGKRFVDEGIFHRADDVFFLFSKEISEAIEAKTNHQPFHEVRNLIAERRELREARKRLHPPGTIPFEASEHPSVRFKETQIYNDADSDTLLGVPVSPGKVSGPASLIKTPEEFGLMKPGSILVCPMTNPAWTPLFAHAAGLVTDMGGILGHGSIVAREYGIPAVVGTGIGTQRIKHEQQITIDGDLGSVKIDE